MKGLTLLVGAALAGLLFWGAPAFVPPLEVVPVAPSPTVTDRTGRLLWVGLTGDDEVCLPLSLDEMGRWLPLVVVDVEDRRFFHHGGIDWVGLVRAAGQNLLRGRIVSGGSTVTSQLVRLVHPRPRTYRAKAVEFLQALALERRLSKGEILEAYLNRAPFGGNVRGAGAAALAWWGKKPSDLTLAEAATLAALLKGPTRYRPDLHRERMKARRDFILSELARRGQVSEAEADLARAEPLPSAMTLPRENYLFVAQVLRRGGGRSTLDGPLQRRVDGALAAALRFLPEAVTAAAVVVDNDDGSVRAYCGNGRFGAPLPWGWVDCADAPRSPGSTLKPFVYAMALDEGRLSPSSLLADTPLSLSGRAPRNFDLRYRGPVSLADALADSLNVPAVRTMRLVGTDRFLHRLRTLGFSHLAGDAVHYGDSLVLGGCEVTLLEMARAYRTFASGRQGPLRFTEGAPTRQERSPFSEASAFIVSQILGDGRRLSRAQRSLLAGPTGMAFKTGTSYGLRDAWVAAWNEKGTVVVWMGDPLGTPHAELIGIAAAVPVAVEIMAFLGGDLPRKPSSVVRRQVCSLSGLPPTSACPQTRQAWQIVSVSPATPCPLHRWQGEKTQTFWPRDLASCGTRALEEAPLRVVSPLDGATYILPPWGEPPRVALTSEGGQGRVSWFVNGRYLGTGGAGEPLFWTVEEGLQTIGAVDEKGRSHSVRIRVAPWSDRM
ncbi:MAG: penicillin-binding protein 1C [Synergistaceae bacterium]|nr:penicillin-binding protein 1C [Synergistaceae bacterium]